jgi:hypothetical protein
MDESEVAAVETSEPAAEVEIQGSEAEAGQEQSAETKAETPPPVQEKMIPQSQVNKIAAREARQAAEKARQEMQAQYQRENVSKDVQPKEGSQMGGMQQMSPEQIEHHIMAAAQRMSVNMTSQKMAEDFESKINAEILEDPDFGDLYDSLKIAEHPELVIWMNGMDNSAKVVKDLANNPTKFANILMLAKSGMGQLAQRELKKLSDSIKTNQDAQAAPQAKAPLDRLSPSSVGVGNGDMSVSDFQKMDWLRG